jgi:maleate isomerase
MPCMAWPTVENVALLEQDLGVPVFSSVMSMAWNALRQLDIDGRQPGLGALFERTALTR